MDTSERFWSPEAQRAWLGHPLTGDFLKDLEETLEANLDLLVQEDTVDNLRVHQGYVRAIRDIISMAKTEGLVTKREEKDE